MRLLDFVGFLREEHPALYTIVTTYKNPKSGVKKVANMYGVECQSIRQITESMLDEVRNRIEFGAVDNDKDDARFTLPTPKKHGAAKTEQIREDDYEQYGSW